MKKIAIITIFDRVNLGNRLQNYAVQEILKRLNFDVETVKNDRFINKNYKIKNKLLLQIHYLLLYIKYFIILRTKRINKFSKFNKNIKLTKRIFYTCGFNNLDKYDHLIVGSDQVWNPTFDSLSDFELLSNIENKSKIALSASFGISELPEKDKERTREALEKFKMISVREDAGKKIVEELTERNDIEVLVDPTMLLNSEEWDRVSKKPEQLKSDKYILNYFLGELSEKRRKEIERIAKENDCEIINILDKKSPFYQTGPSEFLYLEKNAFLICTDSFHSCIFAILYNRPFIVFDREDSTVSMNSRIETLLNKFNLQDREYKGEINSDLLEHDYRETYRILEKEKEKSKKFLEKALYYNK